MYIYCCEICMHMVLAKMDLYKYHNVYFSSWLLVPIPQQVAESKEKMRSMLVNFYVLTKPVLPVYLPVLWTPSSVWLKNTTQRSWGSTKNVVS